MKKMSDNKYIGDLLERLEGEEFVSKVQSDPDAYYDIVNNYGLTNKLNKIINNYPDTVTTKSALYKKIDLNIGIICDEFLYYSLKDSANLVYIPHQDNLEIDASLDVLLVVTSWRGLDHTWDYVANPNGSKREKLLELIRLYKNSGIPTIFYSKEDPVSYQEYLSIAKECDYIFTSANEMIEQYKLDTSNENVDILEFGINPMYHNPIGKDLTNNEYNKIVTFAGSWMKRFPLRNKEAKEIFEGVNKTNYELAIIDRQYEREMERYHYPSYFLRNVSATIPHERLMKLHKLTSWGVNLNSVKDSNTMFANRIYELQAMGNIVLSNYNTGVHNKFPNVNIVNNRKEIESILETTTLKEQKHLIANGIASVMLNHTAYHRMKKIVDKLGFEYKVNNPKILIVGEGENSKISFDKQLYNNIDYIDIDEFEKDSTRKNGFDFITFFSNNILYKEHYLENILSAFAYTDSDVVFMNKDKYYYSSRNEYLKSTAMFKVSSYDKVTNKDENIVYFNIPKTEITNFHNTRERDISEKTLTIIVPVFTSIKHLQYKSLSQLRKYNLSDHVNIKLLLNSAPSKDENILLQRLYREYTNLEYIISPENSFAQMKNDIVKTIETPYLMFLKDDSQLSIKNFIKMFKKVRKDNEIDMIYGNTNSEIMDVRIHEIEEERIIQFKELDYSLEGIIIKTSLFEDNKLHYNEYVYDNKNLLLAILTMAEKKVKYDKPVVNKFYLNTVNKKFNHNIELSEMLKIESATFSILKEEKLLESYTNSIFPDVFLSQYMNYFKNSNKDKRVENFNIIEIIWKMYKPYYKRNNKSLNKILDLLFDEK